MRRSVIALVAIVAILSAVPASADTQMVSTTTAVASSAYDIGGLAKVTIQVEAASGTATATVTIEQRMGPTRSWQLIKTITDPVAGAVAYDIEPTGEVRVNVSVISAGTVRAFINGYYYDGKAKW